MKYSYKQVRVGPSAQPYVPGSCPCKDCGRDFTDYWVKPVVWAAAGLLLSDLACVACLLKRLGRPLCARDFDPWWQWKSLKAETERVALASEIYTLSNNFPEGHRGRR